MIGINGALAAGLQRNHGWKIVALAGVAAISPDWDGLTLVAGMSTFNQAHRVWGHNVLVVVLLGAALAAVDYRFDLMTRVARGTMRRIQLLAPAQANLNSPLMKIAQIPTCQV